MRPLWQWEFVDPGPRPDVSIVICAHGRVAMTLDCLWALHEAQFVNEARAEVIVVDDASPDDLRAKLASVRGLRVVGLDENVGFLRAANSGIAASLGRHIHLLNNDTLPQGRWLDPLLERLERGNALAVGSRLVFEDGSLQEAGGIIFRDGSGWNYGRGGRPDSPQVGYARRVDYCSAASLLVDGTFLRARGGFDERYAPAYYEDTDLCFAAREVGGEVWYEPTSIVVHLEGQSHGTDESAGLKRHQVLNREVFCTRHAAALERQLPPGEESVGVARERVQARIVVVDNEVPTADRDSGSLRLTSLMRGLVEDGYGVTFLPVNGWRRPPYTRQLEAMGIEVLGTQDQWWPHLKQIGASVTHVWLSRPDVAAAFVDRFREALPHATIVYDTVDLHFLRQERGASVLSDPRIAEEARLMRDTEVGLMRAVDRVVVVSPVEQELLLREEGVTSHVVPNVHERVPGVSSPLGRDGLLFVGSFRHPPNGDAVRWLVHEVMPLVWQEHPDLAVRIAGPEAPPDIDAMGSDGRVEVLGWVPDLTALYSRARVVVAPLRFGAGLKGKVGEALAHGVPTVLTTIAAEGTDIVDGEHALVADDEKEFARAVCDLLVDDDLWWRVSTHGRDLVERAYSPEAVRRQVWAVVGDERAAAPAEPALTRIRPDVDGHLRRLEAEAAGLRRRVSRSHEAASVLTEEVERLRSRIATGDTASAAHARADGPPLAPGLDAASATALGGLLERALTDAQIAREMRAGRSYRLLTRIRALAARLRGTRVTAAGEDAERLTALAMSGLVDPDWYYANYPDVAVSGVDAFEHFVTEGWRERRSPGPRFDTEWYLTAYPEVLAADINPAIHYVIWGWEEGRLPHSSAAAPTGHVRVSPSGPADGPDDEAPPPTLQRPTAVGAGRIRVLHLNSFLCAGAPMSWILERNYPGGLLYVESGDPGSRLPWHRLAESVDLSHISAATSHLVTLPDVGTGLADMVVGFVRDPRARLYAAYIDEKASGSPRVPGETFDDFLARIANTPEANYQTRILSPQYFGPVEQYPGWELRPGQIDLHRSDLFVGVVERFEESMVVLEHLMASRGLAFDAACPDLPDAAPATAGVEAEAAMRVMDVDRALYERVNQRLTELLARLPEGGGPALEDYRLRCTALRMRRPAVPVLGPEEWLRLPAS